MDQKKIDARGLRCPLPLLKLKQGLVSIEDGGQLQLISTDAGSWRDVQAFIELSEHTLVSKNQTDGEYVFVICKGVKI